MKTLTRQIGIEIDLEPLHAYNRAMSGDIIWTTRAKQRIPVKDMESSHLFNCIRMLKGESPLKTRYRCDAMTRRNWIEIMTAELRRRGELHGM